MNFKKKCLSFLVFMLVANMFVIAQDYRSNKGRQSPEERANKQTERMIEKLDLSAAQGEKIKATNLEFAKKIMDLRKEARESANREGMRENMKKLREEHKANIKKYLTAEQLEKWEKVQTEQPQRGRKRGKKKKDESGS